MLNTTFSVAGFLLLVWLVFAMPGQQSIDVEYPSPDPFTLPVIAEKADISSEPMLQRLDALEQHMQGQQQAQEQLVQSLKEIAGLRQRLSQQTELLKLHQAHLIVSRAQQLHSQGEFQTASTHLLDSKQAIWDAGEFFGEHKGSLHGLMQTIDSISAAWNSSNAQKNVQPINDVLVGILDQQGGTK